MRMSRDFFASRPDRPLEDNTWMGRLLVLILHLILFAAAATPQSGGGTFSPKDLQEDVRVLREAYETLHPGLYRYNTREQMDRAFDALAATFASPKSLRDAYIEYSLFAARIRCGHTYPNFFNQSKSVAAELFQSTRRVPFYFRWLGREMVVIRDFTPDRQLPPGTVIQSIDGIGATAILDRLLPIARADGANDAKRVSYLEVTGDSVYEAFDVYFPLFYTVGERLQLAVRRPGEGPRTIGVASLTYERRIAPIKAREQQRKGGDGPQFEWKILPGGVALLKMPTWALFDSKWDWKQWLNARLDEAVAAHAPALILDLRGNEGGQDVGDAILPRLVARDFPLDAPQRYVRYRQTPEALRPYLDTWDRSFDDWKAAATPLTGPLPPNLPPVPYFRLIRDDDDRGGGVVHPRAPRFAGKVILLVDASNSSATFQFAQTVQRHRLGTLIGQPTGGNRRGINGGAFFFLRLPRSKIELDLPLIATVPDTAQPDAGLAPDIAVQPTAAGIARHRDPEFEAALELVGGAPKKP